MDERPTDLHEGGAAGSFGDGSVVEVKCPRCGGVDTLTSAGCIECGYHLPHVHVLYPGRLERLVADVVRKLTNNKED